MYINKPRIRSMKARMLFISLASRVEMSWLNLLMIRPVGVASNQELVAMRIDLKKLSWISYKNLIKGMVSHMLYGITFEAFMDVAIFNSARKK